MRGKSTSPKLFGGGKINMFVNSRGKWKIPTVQSWKLFINLNRSKNMTNRLALPSNYFNVIVSTDATGVWNAKYLPTATRQAAIHAMGHTNTWQFNILVTFALASSGKKDFFFEKAHVFYILENKNSITGYVDDGGKPQGLLCPSEPINSYSSKI